MDIVQRGKGGGVKKSCKSEKALGHKIDIKDSLGVKFPRFWGIFDIIFTELCLIFYIYFFNIYKDCESSALIRFKENTQLLIAFTLEDS